VKRAPGNQLEPGTPVALKAGMSNKSPNPKPRKPSGLDAVTEQAVTTLIKMLSSEQLSLEMAADAIVARRAKGEDTSAETARLTEQAKAHRAALEKVGRRLEEKPAR
jgi:hypothetical protein